MDAVQLHLRADRMAYISGQLPAGHELREESAAASRLLVNERNDGVAVDARQFIKVYGVWYVDNREVW